MTSKDEVLAVWADVIVYYNRITASWFWYRESDPDSTSAVCETEEAAWQNAAESLPAQVLERCQWSQLGVGQCRLEAEHGDNHDYGPDPSVPIEGEDTVFVTQVEPNYAHFRKSVEGEDKPERRFPTGGDPKSFCVCGHHEMCHANYANMNRACNQRCGCKNYKLEVAEPKPTPSDIELDLRRMMWMGHGHTGMYGDDGEMQCMECRPFGVVDYKREPLDKVRETFRAVQMKRMNQPRNSSSISTEPVSVEADYLLGRCLPFLDTLAHYGDKEAKEVRAEIAKYVIALKGQR